MGSKLAHKDSNLEMTESESVALPFGDGPMFSTKYIIYEFISRYSEVDSQGKITLAAILDYFQDCSIFHSEELNVGISYLERQKMAWVLSSWQIEIRRYPEIGERTPWEDTPAPY